MQDTDPQRNRLPGVEGDVGAGWLERKESELTIVGPLAIGIAAACYGAISGKFTPSGALVAGWVLWQLSLIVVLIWIVANTKDDPEDVDRMRRGYEPRRSTRNRR
jgi:hypothetical protein